MILARKQASNLADSRNLVPEGSGNIVIRSNDGKRIIIEDVMYVSEMKCNLMSTSQLVEKGFSMTMGGDSLKLFDSKKNLVLKSNMS